MEEVTMYRSDSGKLFRDKEDAEKDDLRYGLMKTLRSVLTNDTTSEIMDNLDQVCNILASHGFVKVID